VGEGIVLLYLLPIGLLAVYFGPLAGTAAASVSLLLFGVWVVAQDVDVGAIGFLTRLRAATPQSQTCSAGVAYWDRSESSETLLGRADAALYEAKRAGRNRVVSSG
jgi:GGDEF domain-containing protein